MPMRYAEAGEVPVGSHPTPLDPFGAVVADVYAGYLAQGCPVRLLVMPDPHADYYHPTWKTDGSEGNFGRMRQ